VAVAAAICVGSRLPRSDFASSDSIVFSFPASTERATGNGATGILVSLAACGAAEDLRSESVGVSYTMAGSLIGSSVSVGMRTDPSDCNAFSDSHVD